MGYADSYEYLKAAEATRVAVMIQLQVYVYNE